VQRLEHRGDLSDPLLGHLYLGVFHQIAEVNLDLHGVLQRSGHCPRLGPVVDDEKAQTDQVRRAAGGVQAESRQIHAGQAILASVVRAAV
jgi:hypothetical protein